MSVGIHPELEDNARELVGITIKAILEPDVPACQYLSVNRCPQNLTNLKHELFCF